MRRWILAPLLCFSVAFVISGCPSWPYCRIDDNCGGGDHCVNGRCQQCGHANHCSGGQRCVEGRCQQ